jgi:hypothetical protein
MTGDGRERIWITRGGVGKERKMNRRKRRQSKEEKRV